eukprot:1180167-Prorocentrum_minimum.AAC.5
MVLRRSRGTTPTTMGTSGRYLAMYRAAIPLAANTMIAVAFTCNIAPNRGSQRAKKRLSGTTKGSNQSNARHDLRLVRTLGIYCLPSCDWFSHAGYTPPPPLRLVLVQDARPFVAPMFVSRNAGARLQVDDALACAAPRQ